jgi:hypothetical protein
VRGCVRLLRGAGRLHVAGTAHPGRGPREAGRPISGPLEDRAAWAGATGLASRGYRGGLGRCVGLPFGRAARGRWRAADVSRRCAVPCLSVEGPGIRPCPGGVGSRCSVGRVGEGSSVSCRRLGRGGGRGAWIRPRQCSAERVGGGRGRLAVGAQQRMGREPVLDSAVRSPLAGVGAWGPALSQVAQARRAARVGELGRAGQSGRDVGGGARFAAGVPWRRAGSKHRVRGVPSSGGAGPQVEGPP